jgi:hypothetical protein
MSAPQLISEAATLAFLDEVSGFELISPLITTPGWMLFRHDGPGGVAAAVFAVW